MVVGWDGLHSHFHVHPILVNTELIVLAVSIPMVHPNYSVEVALRCVVVGVLTTSSTEVVSILKYSSNEIGQVK